MAATGEAWSPTASAFERLLGGDSAALARALSILERSDTRADALAARLRPHTGRALVVGFTGPPGAGKSTLIGAYIAALRADGEKVAVLAVDPSSPYSGGAVLGDRTRMGAHTLDPGVFIRSVASRGHLGGLSLSIPVLVDAVDAAGWPTIILETVGAGQSETEIIDFADIKVVLNAPGLGDDVQTMKAGVLEIADVLVVNKSDLPFAEQTRGQLEAMLERRDPSTPKPPIVCTSASNAEGITDLVGAIHARSAQLGSTTADIRIARRLRGLLTRSVEAELHARLSRIDDAHIDDVCSKIRAGTVTMHDATEDLLAACLSSTTRLESRAPVTQRNQR
ncbi:MAG: methylmalonyl Co-A mutase-associated GTPase MeaB [Actinomycetia bacterium]|nr:methylmalonyl Co-A mutase-associated GTPase MeaB [Actinomycetes bacterium]MCP5032486.1 methylmalonyl Co-A mutase-associated GTPase MeaB [Actinomycetes bacterium]